MSALTLVCINGFYDILQGYLIDSCAVFAVFANAPLAFGRALLSACFPIFGRQMFAANGSNIARPTFAIIETLFCVIAHWFDCQAATICERSKYAMHVKVANREEVL